MQNDVIERFNYIRSDASLSELEAIQQEGSILFRWPQKARQTQARIAFLFVFVFLMFWEIFIIGFVMQAMKPPFSWWSGGVLGALAIIGTTTFARMCSNTVKAVKADYFLVDGDQRTIVLHRSQGEETIAFHEIDYFVFWIRLRLSDTEQDTRLVTQEGKEIVLHCTTNEKLSCMLGYLCEKPAWVRDADGKLTLLTVPETLQQLLHPSSAPNSSPDLLRPVPHSPSIAQEQLLHPHGSDAGGGEPPSRPDEF